jgi:hypothetical protein
MIEYHNELGAVLSARLTEAQNRVRQFSREEIWALPQQELVEREWLLIAAEPLVFDFDAISRPVDERATQVKRPRVRGRGARAGIWTSRFFARRPRVCLCRRGCPRVT